MKHRGTVSRWLESYGFIQPDQRSLGFVYLHISDLGSALAELIRSGTRLEFDVVPDEEGRWRAKGIEAITVSEDLSDSGHERRSR